MALNLNVYRNRLRRLRILQVLHSARPNPVGTGIVAGSLKDDTDLELDTEVIHQVFDYLQQSKLCEITNKTSKWMAKITPAGIDYLESQNGNDYPGIAHAAEF